MANLSSPEPESVEAPPITQTPVLDERLPWLDGRDLLLFSSTRTADELIVWDGSVAEPQRFPLSGANIVDFEPEPRTTNFIAYETSGNAFALYVGGWQRQEPIFVGTHGFDWDPAGTGTLMWLGTDQITGATSLYRRELNRAIELVAPMPDDARLIGWNEAGLVVRIESGGPVNFVNEESGVFEVRQPAITSLYDPSGTLIASALADPLAVTPSGPIVARGTSTVFAEGEIEIPEDVDVTPPDTFVLLDPPSAASAQFGYRPIPKRDALADTEVLFSSQRPWSVSADASWAGRAVTRDNASTLVVHGLTSQAVRVIPLASDHARATVGFSQDGQWFFLWSPQSNELVIVDPDAGAQFELPIEGNVRIRRAFLRDR